MADTKYTILIVDDNADFLDLTEQDLVCDLFELKTFLARESVEDVLQAVMDIKPSLVLLDLYLPSGPALPLCESMKALEGLQSMPVYFISFAERSDLEKIAKDSCANGCLSKPLRLEAITKLIKEHYNE